MATPSAKVELARPTDGPRYRRVWLELERDGALSLNLHEMGGAPDAAWGADDNEVSLSAPAEQIGRLAIALAAELLRRESDPIGRLADICEDAGVNIRVAHWT